MTVPYQLIDENNLEELTSKENIIQNAQSKQNIHIQNREDISIKDNIVKSIKQFKKLENDVNDENSAKRTYNKVINTLENQLKELNEVNSTSSIKIDEYKTPVMNIPRNQESSHINVYFPEIHNSRNNFDIQNEVRLNPIEVFKAETPLNIK